MNARTLHRPRPRRRVAALLVAVGLVGLSGASAAGLGGLTRASLGGDSAAVASCDTDGVTLAWGAPAYQKARRHYTVRTVTISGIARACTGRRIRMVVARTSGAVITNGTVVIAGTTATVTLAAAANVNALTKIAVVIS